MPAIFQRFRLVADAGRTKGGPADWPHLQNVRGWGGRGRKRQGVATVARPNASVLGFFDIENGAGSADKILVWLRSGAVVLYDYSELATTFDYLMDGGLVLLQSPSGTWYEVGPNATTAMLQTVEANAPAVSRATDLTVGAGETFGWLGATRVLRLVMPTTGFPTVREYALASGAQSFSTDLAFDYGSGLVLTDERLVRRRLAVLDGGILTTTEL
jgi:hypothetical protein